MIRKSVLLLGALLCCPAFGQSYSIAAGASTATINSTLATAAAYSGAGNVTVTVAAGVSSGLGQITFPCSTNPMTLTGQATGYPQTNSARPTSIWRGNNLDLHLLKISSCSTVRAVLNLEIDGNQPATGGGGITAQYPQSNLTIVGNYIHGNEEIYPIPCNSSNTCTYGMAGSSVSYYSYDDAAASLIELQGGNDGTATDQQNVLIQYNILGNPVQTYPTNQWIGTSTANLGVATSNGDCVNVQQWTLGPGASGNLGYDRTGGYCDGIRIRGGSTNLHIYDNYIQNQEQGIKFFECGQTTSTYCYQTGLDVERNTVRGIHRIGLEAQQTPTDSGNVANAIFRYNVYMDPKDPTFGSWIWSVPQGGFTRTNTDSNLFISDCGNATHPNFCAQHNAGPGSVEYWGSNLASANYNLTQGTVSRGVQWGYGGGNSSQCPSGTTSTTCWQALRNACEGSSIGGNGNPGYCVVNEGNQGQNPASPPLVANTVIAASPTTKTANAPTISPATQSFTGSRIVTRGISQYSSTTSLPQGNQNIWYTTDGSTPVPQAGTAQFYTGPFTITTATTVKAVGMWGGITQPASYTTNYGFAPSAVVSTSYTTSGGGTGTLTSIALTGTSSLVVGGGTSQLVATGTYSNSTTGTISPTTWTSSAPSICTVSSSGLVTPVAAGTCNITATLTAVTSPAYPVTVTAPTVTSSYLGTTPTANVNMLTVGQTVQMTLTNVYSNGTSAPATASSWAVLSGGSFCSITSPAGVVTATAAGSCQVQANGTSSSWGFTITNATATLTAINLSGASSSLVVGAVQALSATGIYSSGPQQAVTPTAWASDTPGVATVDAMGNVTAVSPGTANITASLTGITSSPFTLAVTPTQNVLVSTTSSLNPVAIYSGQQLQLSLTGNYNNQTQQPIIADGGWTTSDPTVATVNAGGVVTFLKPGSVSFTGTGSGVQSQPVPATVVPFPFTLNLVPTPYGGPILQSQALAPGVYKVVVTASGVTVTASQ
jgi:hypothetical protein